MTTETTLDGRMCLCLLFTLSPNLLACFWWNWQWNATLIAAGCALCGTQNRTLCYRLFVFV